VTATAVPSSPSSPGHRSSDTNSSRPGHHPMTRRWSSTGPGGVAAAHLRWTDPGCACSRRNMAVVRSVGNCCCTPTTSHKPRTSGKRGSRSPARQSANKQSPRTRDTARRTNTLQSASYTPTAHAGLRQRRQGPGSSACHRANRACLSRMNGKRSSPVLRGPRRGNAPGLPAPKPSRVSGVWNTETLSGSDSPEELWGGAGKPTVRGAEFPDWKGCPRSECRRPKGNRKAGPVHTGTSAGGFPYNWPDTGPGARTRKGADVWQVGL
jgi:hypothetical protein